MSTPWYRAAFGPSYLAVYRRRDEDDARKLKHLLDGLGCPVDGRRVLDIGCGPGRHLRVLEGEGAETYGIDLSSALLAEARNRRPDERVALADMRALPFPAEFFDLALLLFTTFGYFETDEENVAVLLEAGRVLKPGGPLIIDTINAAYLRAHLVSETRRQVDALRLDEMRWIDEERRRINKTVEIRDPDHPGGVSERWTESVRLWTPQELERVLDRGRFSVTRWAGGFDASEFSEHTSERMIVLAEKQSSRY
jgi:SAM-dependent methyltransferase